MPGQRAPVRRTTHASWPTVYTPWRTHRGPGCRGRHLSCSRPEARRFARPNGRASVPYRRWPGGHQGRNCTCRPARRRRQGNRHRRHRAGSRWPWRCPHGCLCLADSTVPHRSVHWHCPRGIAGIIIGSDLVVKGASFIAGAFGLSDVLIGLTIVAIGTSLPELVTSVTALKKGDNGIVIGNVLGSSIFNILFILGISGAIMPLPIAPEMVSDIALMTVITIIGAIFAYSKNEVDKKEGAILVALFILYMAFVIIRN